MEKQNRIMASALGEEFLELLGSYENPNRPIEYFVFEPLDDIMCWYKINLDAAMKAKEFATKFFKAYWDLYSATELTDARIEELYKIVIKKTLNSKNVSEGTGHGLDRTFGEENNIRDYNVRLALQSVGINPLHANHYMFHEYYHGGIEEDTSGINVSFCIPSSKGYGAFSKYYGHVRIHKGDSIVSIMKMKKTALKEYLGGEVAYRHFLAFLKMQESFLAENKMKEPTIQEKREFVERQIDNMSIFASSKNSMPMLIEYLRDIRLTNAEIKHYVFNANDKKFYF